MATVPRSYIDGYADGLEDISREMKRALADALVEVDWDRPVAEVREELVAIMRTYCGTSAGLASDLAAEFYSGLRLRLTGDAGTPLATGGGYSDSAVEGAVRATVQPLADGRADAVDVITQALLERLGYEVKSAAGKTIFENGRRDSKRVRYARIPRGSKSYPSGCPFCQMLASRGFKYRSELTAGGLDPDHYHDGCQCMVVPGFGDNPKVEGYDPHDYDEGYGEYMAQDHSEHEMNTSGKKRTVYDLNGELKRAASRRPTSGMRYEQFLRGKNYDALVESLQSGGLLQEVMARPSRDVMSSALRVRELLSKVIDLGPRLGKKAADYFDVSELTSWTSRGIVEGAARYMPSWWLDLLEGVNIVFKETTDSRARYEPSERAIYFNPDACNELHVLHELIHALERNDRRFFEAERAYFEERTSGCVLRALR